MDLVNTNNILKTTLVTALLLASPLIHAIPMTSEYAGDQTPVIALENRVGAEQFAAVNVQLISGAYDQVIKHAEGVIDSNSDHGLAHEVLGAALVMSGKPDLALPVLDKAITLEPTVSGALTKLGIVYMEQGQTDNAIQAFEQALSRNPADRFAHQRLGLLHEYQKNYPLAARHLYHGLKDTPAQYLGAAVNLANVLNKMRRNREAVAVLEPRLPIATAVPADSHLILGAAYYASGKYTKAIARFERYIELLPDSSEARLGIAQSQAALGQHETALEIMQRLILERPVWPAVRVELGKLHLRRNHYEKAVAAFEQAQSLGEKPAALQRRLARHHIANNDFLAASHTLAALIDSEDADPSAYTDYSEVLLSQNDQKGAEKILLEGLERFADNAYLHLRFGAVRARLQQYDAALPEISRAADLAPNDPTTLRAFSLVQSRLGNKQGALNSARTLYELMPTRVEAIMFYAVQLDSIGKKAEAENMYRQTLEHEQENIIALNNLANILVAKNQLQEAGPFAERAFALAPESPQTLDTYGWVLYRQGQLTDAEELLKKASVRAPGSATIQFHHGMLLSDLGKKDLARAALQQALEMAPAAKWAEQAKARLQGS